MNVKLIYETDFLSINIIDQRIYPNNYTIKLHLLTVSDDPVIQNVAFDRIKFLIKEIYHNSIFTDLGNKKLQDIVKLSPNKLVLLPEPAYDQIIGVSLYCKLNAILKNEMLIEELQVSSSAGDEIRYAIDENDDFGSFNIQLDKVKKNLPWWHREDLTTTDSKGKLVVFDWKTVNLDWAQEEIPIEIEFEFNPDAEEKPVTKKKRSKKKSDDIYLDQINKEFTPTILPGGKDPENED